MITNSQYHSPETDELSNSMIGFHHTTVLYESWPCQTNHVHE